VAPRRRAEDDGAGRGRGRPTKSLQQHVDDGSFERRKHEALLITDELVLDVDLRKLQQRYRRLKTEAKRAECSLEFEKLARAAAPDRNEAAAGAFAERIRTLGRRGSGEFVINFFEAFYVWDDGSPWRLDPWQKDYLRELFRRDRLKRRIYQEALLGTCRGQGKTPLASGLGCEELATAPHRMNGYQIAGSKLQASLGTEYATNWIDDSKELQLALRARANSVVRRDGRGAYTVLSSDGRLSHGRHGRILAIADELWLYRTDAEVQGYVALESTLHKHPESFLQGISTAGYDKRSLLGRKYKRGLNCPKVETRREGFLTIGRDEEAGFLMWWYGMPEGYELDLENDAAVLRALKLANPGSWTDYRAQLRSLKRAMNGDVEDDDDIQDIYEWLRLCLNFWTAVKGTWLRPGTWRQLADKTVAIPRGADVYVGVDAAHSYDTTAVSWSWVDPATGRVVTRCRIFSVRKQVPAHVYVDKFYNPRTNEHVAERFIHELADVHGFRVREVVADPTFFGGELARLGLRFLTAPIYPWAKEMREYVQRFYRDVAGRQMVTDGDPIVTAHVEAIQGEKSSQGYWTITALHQSEPIDGGIATMISNGRARIDRSEISVYDSRDLVVAGGDPPKKKKPTDQERDDRAWRRAHVDDDDVSDEPDDDVDDEEDEWDL
jgi:phage terminase large subunit-like protein